MLNLRPDFYNIFDFLIIEISGNFAFKNLFFNIKSSCFYL